MKQIIIEMLELQDKLNISTNWQNWRKWITDSWKIINWKRCIYMEVAEAINSISWKHWKNIEDWIDLKNFQIEIVDIWHFIMSYLLINNSIDILVKKISININEKSNIKLPKILTKEENLKLDNILLPYENLMRLSLKKINTDKYVNELIKSFFICLDSTWMNFLDLYKLYIWKNVLNKFRQDYWYKEWTYKKIWNWIEDNVYVQKITENMTWFEKIYKELEKIYTNLKN